MPTRSIDTTHPAFTRALAELRPQLDLIASDRIERIRHDIEASIVLVLGVAPAAMALQAEARAQLGEEAARHFGLMETSARVCARAHADHQITVHGTDLEELVGKLSQTRTLLLLEAQSLVNKKHVPSSLLGELVGGTGYRAMAFDVLQLIGVFRTEGVRLEEHTRVSQAELDEAEARANVLLTTLGQNDQADSSNTPSADLRRRAYTFFIRTYEEVRRAVTFLRWEAGDVDAIAPSLSAGRTRRRVDEDDVIEQPIAPAPINGAVIRPGMPGAPPFSAS